MLRFVARVLIARQHDLCRTAWGDASDVVPKFVWPADFRGPVDRSSQGAGILLTPTTISSCSSVSSLTWRCTWASLRDSYACGTMAPGLLQRRRAAPYLNEGCCAVWPRHDGAANELF